MSAAPTPPLLRTPMPPGMYRGRFAPSPTGPLHAGSLLAALLSWLHARHAGGEWLVRIEDLDPPREVPGSARAQLDALARFGLVADHPPTRQSAHGDRYQAALDQLLDGNHAFECHCSRSDLDRHVGVHRDCVPGRRRPHPAIRLRVPDGCMIGFDDLLQGRVEQDVATAAGDVVLRRADGLWAYQLAVVVDDAWQAVSHVVRGADLIDSTPRQILLQRRLALPTPRYLHLPLLVDAAGDKLSKSLAALPVDADAPLPTLRLLWGLLGQDLLAVPGNGPPERWLAHAAQAFEPHALPSTRTLTLAASHNGVVAPRA